MVGELAGTHDSGVDLSTSCTEPGIPTSLDDRARGVGHGRVQAQEHKAVRQCAWQFRKVPSVQRSVQVEPSSRGMGLHGFIAILTIALTMLREHSSGGPQEPSNDVLQQFIKVGSERQIEGHAKSTSLYYDFLDLFQRTATGPDEPNAEHGHGGPDSHQHTGRTAGDAGGHQKQLRPVPGGEPRGHHPCPGQQPPIGQFASDSRGAIGSGSQRGGHDLRRRGVLKRLRGDLNRAIHVYEAELSIYKNLPTVTDRPPPTMDLLELFAGSSKFTLYSKKYQLNALAPMDLQHGQDFREDHVQQEI